MSLFISVLCITSNSTKSSCTYHSKSFLDHFNIYTREAGAGNMSVAVEGPSKAEMNVIDRGHGYTTVSYKVKKEGNIKFLSIFCML